MWENDVSDNYDDADSPFHEHVSDQHSDVSSNVHFGDFNVISPGVHIVIEGRPVSNTGH